jgi:hypothetical protein
MQKIMHCELCCETAAIPHCQCILIEFVQAQVKHEVADSYPVLLFGSYVLSTQNILMMKISGVNSCMVWSAAHNSDTCDDDDDDDEFSDSDFV